MVRSAEKHLLNFSISDTAYSVFQTESLFFFFQFICLSLWLQSFCISLCPGSKAVLPVSTSTEYSVACLIIFSFSSVSTELKKQNCIWSVKPIRWGQSCEFLEDTLCVLYVVTTFYYVKFFSEACLGKERGWQHRSICDQCVSVCNKTEGKLPGLPS